MLIWYHDEFQMECRPKLVDTLSQIACKAIKWAGEYLAIPFPHAGDANVGRNWAECH